MTRALLSLCVALAASPAWGAGDDSASTTSSSASLDRVDELAREGRNDEAVALLLRMIADGEQIKGATKALRNLAFTNPPRRAWAEAYRVALIGGSADEQHKLKVLAARADLQSADSRDGALRRLQTLLEARPDDAELRVATAEALLESGRFDAAERMVGARDAAAMRRVRVAALIGLDRLDDARKVDEASIPAGCATSGKRMPCASGLEEMGYPGAAAASLRRALRNNHPDLRTRGAQASAYARVGKIEQDRGELVIAIRAWREAHRLAPTNHIYKDALSNLLAESGRMEEAAAVVGDSDGKLRSTIDAVRLVQSVDPGAPGAGVDAAIARARELDADHPLVVQATAHWLISRDRADEALQLLQPYVETRMDNAAFLDLYIWAAGESDRSVQAAEVVESALARVDDPARWSKRSAQLSTLYTQAAEQAKGRGDLDQAVALYERARTTDPSSIRVLVGLGGVLWKRGDTDAAAAVYRDALRRAPGNRVALFSLVELLRLDGDEGQARDLLRASGYDDLKVRALQEDLAVMAAARKARSLREAGRLDASLAEFERLVEAHPNQPSLLHAYADTLLEAGRSIEAAETYARARALSPDNSWLVLGEITALVNLQQPEEARRLLARLPANPEDPSLQAGIRSARWSIERVEADRLVARGQTDAAVTLLERWTQEADDGEAGVAIGDLYLSRWQHEAAAAWYRWALAQAPNLDAAQRGLVRTDMGRGDLDAAEERVGDLVEADPSPANLALARSVARRRTLERAIAAAAEGDHVTAERVILDQIRRHPDDLDLQVAHARLLLLRGEPRSAMREAQGVLSLDRDHPDALSVVQTAALGLGEAHVALEAYELAVATSDQPWLRDEVTTLRLAARLDRAREAHAKGPRESADAIIDEATKFYGDNRARRWSLIGGAWLDVGRPERARQSYEMARRLAPADGGAAIGLAGAWETLGQPARAESILANHWAAHQDPAVGLALLQLQQRRGHDAAAHRTYAELRTGLGHNSEVIPSGAPPPEALTVIAPEGQTVPDDDRRLDPDAPTWGTVSIEGHDGADDSYPVAATLGGGWIGRPGDSGLQFLNALYVPFAITADLPGPIDIEGEIVGVNLSDGAREASGASMSAALTTGLAGPWAAQARLGRDTVVSDGFQPMTTWFLGANGRVTGGLSAEVQAAKAPVTDTLTSWAGSYSAEGVAFGRVFDTWAGAGLSYGWSDDSTLGLMGRVGHADDNAEAGPMGQVPWRQALAYGRMPIQVEGRRTTYAGFEGIVLDHDRQVDGFAPGQGGMFTPDLFATLIARLEVVLAPDAGRWTACGLAGAGPQVVQGEQTLFLFPGTYLGYQLAATAQMELGRSFWLTGHAMHAGSFGAWGQTGVFGQLRYGQPAALSSPGPTLGSLVHGPPLTQPAACPQPRKEVGR